MCLIDVRALSARQTAPLPKLQIGCNTVVQEGMVVETNSEKVRDARRAVLEFLLINHPIDCPICDQAGECKLQEYYMDFGRHESRFPLEEKVRKHKVVAVGPDIMLDQERCILCTRCVRFLDEVTETHELLISERGDHCELSLATGARVDNPYATNIVDICPVGALTSRRFRFQARVWYLDAADSICTGCATGCNTEVHSRGDTIYRIRPRFCEGVNGYWMCDYGRETFIRNYAADRLTQSLTREDDQFIQVTASGAATRIARALRSTGPVAIACAASVSVEEAYLLAVAADLLGGCNRVVISPEQSDVATDDWLISTDRYPNRQGLRALGFREAAMPPEGMAGLVLVRCDEVDGDPAWAARLEGLQVTVVFADRYASGAAHADHVVAIASHFEAEGSFVNRQGRLQRFAAAIRPPGEAVPGWQGLAELVAELGGPRYASHAAVLEAALARLGTIRPAEMSPVSTPPQPASQ
jgi:NADH-quinone oxidoreductase subunit G